MNQRKSEPLTHCRIKYIMHGVARVYSNIKQQQKCQIRERSTMEDKILRTINTICLNFSPFPPLP